MVVIWPALAGLLGATFPMPKNVMSAILTSARVVSSARLVVTYHLCVLITDFSQVALLSTGRDRSVNRILNCSSQALMGSTSDLYGPKHSMFVILLIECFLA